jgi:HAE1 family hydrophobic/amphiphilic exporter-1
VLVVAVIYLFLQDWRTTLIPAITIPVSLIGTFALMKVLGFSINTLTLFGLTLATGLVVDDAIVVIENIARFIQEKKMSPLAGASAAMAEITSAVVATSLVLLAVFIPVAFFPGTTGQLYKQFALTIACSITISLFNALTLTPTLSALLLGRQERPRGAFFRGSTAASRGCAASYHNSLGASSAGAHRRARRAFVLALAGDGVCMFTHADRLHARRGSGLLHRDGPAAGGLVARSDGGVTKRVEEIIRNARRCCASSTSTASPSPATRPTPPRCSCCSKIGRTGPASRTRCSGCSTARAAVGKFSRFRAPRSSASIRPRSTASATSAASSTSWRTAATSASTSSTSVAQASNTSATRDPKLASVFTTFRNDNPQLVVDPDREKAAVARTFRSRTSSTTMQIYLGSLYVNDFDYLNRSYRVYVQADTPYRSSVSDLQIYVRARRQPGRDHAALDADLIDARRARRSSTHYNLFRSIELSGKPGRATVRATRSPRWSAREASRTERRRPRVVGHLARRDRGRQPGGADLRLGIIVVFLVLAAQYESWTDPLIILMSVPLAISGRWFVFIAQHVRDLRARLLRDSCNRTSTRRSAT